MAAPVVTYIVLKLLGPGVDLRQRRQFRDVFLSAGRNVNVEWPDGITVFDVLRRSSRRLTTIQIKSEKPIRRAEFAKLANAFIFQLSYNLDVAFIPLQSLDELARRSRITGMRRSALEEVGFSDGDVVDLSGSEGETRVALSARIYKTRNAIVHSKEGGRGRYTPFHHDRVLLREVPLLRFIAEQIIVSSSSLISSP